MLDATIPELERARPLRAPRVVPDDIDLAFFCDDGAPVVCDDVDLGAKTASECAYAQGDPINLRDPWGLSTNDTGVGAQSFGEKCTPDSPCEYSFEDDEYWTTGSNETTVHYPRPKTGCAANPEACAESRERDREERAERFQERAEARQRADDAARNYGTGLADEGMGVADAGGLLGEGGPLPPGYRAPAWDAYIERRLGRLHEWIETESAGNVLGGVAGPALGKFVGGVTSPIFKRLPTLARVGGPRVALGIEPHLDEFAEAIGAGTWKQWGRSDPLNWKAAFTRVVGDPASEIHVNLTGVDVWGGLNRAARGAGGAMDWELLQLLQHPEWWGRTTFWEGGQVVANPLLR